jgi:hypothetical protein
MPLSLSSIFLSFLAQFNLGLTASSCHVFKLATLIVNILIATWRFSMKRLLILAALAVMLGGEVRADFIVAGRVNNTSPDSFTFVPLRNMILGEVLYFTDNGWTGSQFRGASSTDYDGNENLIKFTANATIGAGTLINSTASNPNWAWTTTGSVGGGTTSGSFANLALGQSGDQIYAFSSTSGNPLFNPGTIHFVLDDTNGFENATDSNTGNKPSGTAGISLNFAATGGIRLKNDGLARTSAEWITYATAAVNWQADTNINNTNNLSVVPEPTTGILLGIGTLACAVFRRNRRIA